MKKNIHFTRSLAIITFLIFILMPGWGWATTFYSQSSGDPLTLSNWNDIRIGGGSSPADFTSGDVFVIQNGHIMTTSAGWTVGGTSSSIQIEAGGTLIASYTVISNQSTIIDGTFQINQGGWATGGTWTYGPGGTLVFNNSSGSYGVNDEAFWPATNSPVNVSVIGAGGITMNVIRTVSGTFQTSAGVINANNLTFNGTAQINAGGYFDSAPTYSTSSTLVYNTGNIYGRGFEWSSTSGAGYPNNLRISNNTTLNYPNTSLMARSIAGSLTIDAGSALYMDFGNPGMNNPLTIAGNLTLDGSLSLGDAVGGDLNIGGTWARTGTFTSNSRAVAFNGSTEQTITGATTFAYLNINNSNGVALFSDITVNNTLNLSNGLLTTGSSNVIMASGANVSGAGSGKYIYGNLRKYVPNTPSPTVAFDIGDATNYTPVVIAFAGTVSGSGYLDASTAVATPPVETGLSQTNFINRNWTVTNTGVTGFTSYSPTFTFVDGDKTGTPNTSALVIRKLDGSTWTATTTGTQAANSTQCTGLTSFSEFAIGEVADAPIVTIQPASSTICSGNNTSFTAASTSTPTPTVQWQRDAGSGFVDITLAGLDAGTTYGGFTTGTLTLTGSTIALSTYQYRAVFTNINGFVNSDPATLTVNLSPAITLQPVDRIMCTGTTDGFTVEPTGLSYQWQYSIDETFWNNTDAISYMTGNTTATLTVTNPQAQSSYYVRCVVTSGSCSTPSNSAQLTINSSPKIITQPASQAVCDGSGTATFKSTATGYNFIPMAGI